MANKTPSGARKHREGTKPGTWKTGEMFFFLSSFFFFRRASSVLPESLTMVLARNSSILHWAVHCPIAFFTTLSTLTGRSGNIIWLRRDACARSRHVATSLQLSDLRTHEVLFSLASCLSWRFVPTVRYFATQLLVLSSGCSHCHYELFHKISWYLLPHIAISATTYCHICYHILPYLLYSLLVSDIHNYLHSRSVNRVQLCLLQGEKELRIRLYPEYEGVEN